jgi:hypothetical protein
MRLANYGSCVAGKYLAHPGFLRISTPYSGVEGVYTRTSVAPRAVVGHSHTNTFMIAVMAASAPAVAAPQALPARPKVVIVPVKGLPIVALVLVGVVVAIARDARWGLVFIHVVGGGLWTAIDLFVGFVIGPIIGRMSIPARTEFSIRFMPKMLLIMPTVVTMTLAAGFQLARQDGFLDTSNPRHAWVVASFAVVGVMAVIALAYLEPANVAVLFELRKPEPDGRVIEKLMRRFVYTAGITGVMQVATLIIMTRLVS